MQSACGGISLCHVIDCHGAPGTLSILDKPVYHCLGSPSLCRKEMQLLIGRLFTVMGCNTCGAISFAGYVPGDAPGASSFFTPKAARKASRLAMQNPVIAQLDTALSR